MNHPHDQLALYVDGSLDADERAGVDAHLAGCETCREEVAAAGRAWRALRSLPEIDLPRTHIRSAMPRRGRVRRRRVPVEWVAGVAAAASIAAIFALVALSNTVPVGGNTAAGGANAGEPHQAPPIVHSSTN